MAVLGRKEPILSWRRSCFLLIALLVVTVFLSTAGTHIPKHPLFTGSKQSVPSQTEIRYVHAFGNATSDNEAIDGLTTAECHALFPDLYKDIDRAVAYWKGINHTISAEDVDIRSDRDNAALRILIHDNEMRVLENSGAMYHVLYYRAMGIMPLLQRSLDSAIAAGEKLPTVEILLNLHDDADPADGRTHTYWTTARFVGKESHDRLWLLPNFDFWWSPPSASFEDAKRLAMQFDHTPFSEKIQKIVWRGNVAMNVDVRGPLVEVSKGKEWADVIQIPSDNPDDRLEEFEYCKYAMTAYTEGRAFSGRLKFLMNCKSLLFVPEAEWAVHYTHLLKSEGPDQNYVAVRRDWADLEEKVKWYLDNPDQAEKVIANSLATFRSRYTTRAATSCYIRQLIQSYATVSYTPEVFVPVYNGEVMARRGKSYADFMQHTGDGNFEHPDHIGE